MADRSDPIVDDTPQKRRKLNNGTSSSAKAWDSQDDSEEFNETDFETAATLPIQRQLQYSTKQFHADLGGATYGRPSQQSHITQPTQALPHVTQPTQPLPDKSQVQVERSSPMAPSSTQKQSQPIHRAPFARPNGILANAMAPPGTAFRRPLGVQPKPAVVDVDSDDDPPVQHSDGESQGSNIKPTNFKRAGRGLDSSPNRIVKESPHASAAKSTNSFDNLLSGFGYRPPPQPADDLISAYGSVSRAHRPQAQRQTGPAKAMAVSSTPAHIYHTLEDIPDYRLRLDVKRMQDILGSRFSINHCMDALLKKRSNVQDAMELLASQQELEDDQDELGTLSPIQRKGVAQSTSQLQSLYSSQPIRLPAKQQVKVPTKSIAEKYNRGVARPTLIRDSDDEDEAEEEQVKQPVRRRLIQGRKPSVVKSPPSSPPPAQVALPPRQRKKPVVIIDSDSEGGPGDASDDDVHEETQEPVETTLDRGVHEMREDRLLKLINECTAHDLSELSGQPEEPIQYVLDRRPFDSLDAVRAVTLETLTKAGNKSKKTKPVGDKLVEDCTEMMTGYDAIDQLVVKCEDLAKPVQKALREWGVGDFTDGELQLMNLDEAHDSGIGTPMSSCQPDDSHTPTQKSSNNSKTKRKFLGQPKNMSTDLIMKNYQLVGLNWLNLLFEQQTSCILADDMGLGKTCQVIAFLSHLQIQKTDGVHLIIVPGSTLENWLREFDRFAPTLSVRPYYGKLAEREEIRYGIENDWHDIDVIVTTYDMAVAKEDNKFLRRLGPFSVCVYDEAHMLRNPNSQRYSSLVRIPADFKCLLTGTPLQNNLQELVAILAFVMPGLFQEKREDLEYIFKHKASTKDTASAALLSNERIMRARTMMTPFILRRKKEQVLDLPKKTSRVEYCTMTDLQANHYHDVLEDAQKFYSDKATGAAKASAKKSSNVIMSLRKAAIHPLLSKRIYDEKKIDKMVVALQNSDDFGSNTPEKIRAYLNGDAAASIKGGDFGLHKFAYNHPQLHKRFALKRKEWMDSGKVKKFEELVTKYAANGDRVLVFSQFTTLMDILEAVLEEMNVKFMRLDGDTQMDTRQDMIDQFYEDTSITVFMLSTKAGGAGINLAAANKVIIFDSGFNPQDDIQAENRAHRVGQMREVEVVRLVTKDTIEEQIHALGESKLALDERVAGDASAADESKAAEKTGAQMVEKMFVENNFGVKGEKKSSSTGDDLKDAFKTGLEGKGVKVGSKQAQY